MQFSSAFPLSSVRPRVPVAFWCFLLIMLVEKFCRVWKQVGNAFSPSPPYIHSFFLFIHARWSGSTARQIIIQQQTRHKSEMRQTGQQWISFSLKWYLLEFEGGGRGTSFVQIMLKLLKIHANLRLVFSKIAWNQNN